MFNNSYKKQTLSDLKKTHDEYVIEYEKTINNIELLHKVRKKSVYILERVEYYINSLSNKPNEFEKSMGLINVNISNFKLNQKEIEKISGGVASTGAIAGVGIAALAPSAATSAALASLGGGSLAAGGGGSALLALAGPIGWAIGGTALVGSGMFASKKNKEIAQKNEKRIIEIKKETARIKLVGAQIYAWKIQTETISSNVNSILYKLKQTGITEFNEFDDNQKFEIMKLINSSESLSKKLGDVIK